MRSGGDSARELQRLRRAHAEAVDRFRYADARRIQSKVDSITARAIAASQSRTKNRRSEIQTQYETADQHYSSDVAELFATYRTRAARLLAKHDGEVRALSHERHDALEREKARRSIACSRGRRSSRATTSARARRTPSSGTTPSGSGCAPPTRARRDERGLPREA
jgi:hypothetical protein